MTHLCTVYPSVARVGTAGRTKAPSKLSVYHRIMFQVCSVLFAPMTLSFLTNVR